MTEAPCEAKTYESTEAAGETESAEARAAKRYNGRLRRHKRDIMVVIMTKVGIAILLVPIAQLAGRLHPIFGMFVGVVIGSLILVGFRLVRIGLDNLALAATLDRPASEIGI